MPSGYQSEGFFFAHSELVYVRLRRSWRWLTPDFFVTIHQLSAKYTPDFSPFYAPRFFLYLSI